MDPQIKLSIFQWATGVLVALYLWQAWLLGRADKLLKKAMELSNASIDVRNSNAEFVTQFLKMHEVNLVAQKDLLDSVKILADRVAAYNERLNELNSLLYNRTRGG